MTWSMERPRTRPTASCATWRRRSPSSRYRARWAPSRRARSARSGSFALGYVLWNYLQHGSAVPGFAFLASIISIFSGVQLFALGIFGEYLARMHFRSMERPPYTQLHHTAMIDQAASTSASAGHVRQA